MGLIGRKDVRRSKMPESMLWKSQKETKRARRKRKNKKRDKFCGWHINNHKCQVSGKNPVTFLSRFIVGWKKREKERRKHDI